MCGLFTVTPKSVSKHSKGEREHEDTCTVQPTYRHTPTHARVNAIMGVSCSYHAYDSATIKAEDGKRRAGLPRKRSSSGSINVDKGKAPVEKLKFPHNGPLRPKSFNDLKLETTNPNSLSDPPSYPPTRPRLYERRKYPSSPLANIGMDILFKPRAMYADH